MAEKMQVSKTIGGEMGGLAFLYWSEKNKRYELKIDNIVKAHTSGDNESDHEEAKPALRKVAEDKGYTVYDA